MSSYSGTIGILTSEQGRFSRFWLRFSGLQLPPQVRLIAKMQLDIASARDEVLQEALGDWVWFIDDDHTFDPFLLKNLLSREVDVIQPLVLSRISPFAPVMMGPETPDKTAQYRLALMDGVDRPGIKECGAVGAAGMLVRRKVWEAVGFPAFGRRDGDPGDLSEDITFCRRVREKGFRVWTDLEYMMGHLNVGEVWPQYDSETGVWSTRITFGGQDLTIPKAKPTMRLKDGRDVELLDGA